MKKDKETFDVLLVGSGNMAMEYLKILKDLKKKVLIVGKRKKNVNFLKNLYPQFSFRYGGVKDFFGGLNIGFFITECSGHAAATAFDRFNV